MSDVLLRVENLDVRYEGVDVLRDVSLELKRGDFASLIGPNGAGKSTLLKAIVGLVPPAGGKIEAHARQIGYVPQRLQFDSALPLTVAEFLSLKLARAQFWFGAAAAQRPQILEQLREIGAAHLIDRTLGRLSGGELQRVLIAYALLERPDLLLLDEPMTGIDIRGGLSFDGILHHLHEHAGITILMVSHDLHLVEHLSDTVFCINGDLCCHGTPSEVLQPQNLAKAYGHLPGMVRAEDGAAFIPMKNIR